MTITKEDYQDWEAIKLADPRGATIEQLIHGMRLIVEAEGPVMASRVFQLCSKAGGLGRIYDATRRQFLRALKQGMMEGVFLAEKEAEEDPGTWILRMPSQATVRVRTLGGRSLHEVPAAEVAEIMLEIRAESELISKEELYRQILEGYGLIRLTEATKNRLDYVLETWF